MSTMKKIVYKPLIFLLAIMVASSCFQDKSTLDTSKIDPILIESEDIPDILRVEYLGNITLEPTVKMGRETNPETLDYKWEINQTPGHTSMVEIGNERILNTTITNQILSAAYSLMLTVTDTEHGLQYQKAWPLYVSSAFREGIIVADTKDGSTSDLNHIMDNSITTSYNQGERITYDIWEKANGHKHPSLIKRIDYAFYSPSAILARNIVTTIYEDKNIQMIDCEDFSVFKEKELIYPGMDASFNPQGFASINRMYWMLTENNKPYVTTSNGTTVSFVMPVSGIQPADNGVIIPDYSNGAGPYAIWYNGETGAFYQIAMMFTTPPTGGAYTTTGVFNPQNVPGREAIAGDLSMDGKTATMLLKDKSTGNYEIYAISFSYYDANWNTIPSTPKLKAELPSELTPILNDAVSVFFNLYDPLMFIATPDKVYAVTFGGGVISYQEVYSPTSGQITKGKLFMQGRYHVNYNDFNPDNGPIFDAPLALNTKAIVLAIDHGGNNGSIEVIPQSNTATGDLNTASAKKYTGFGKILDFTFQGQ